MTSSVSGNAIYCSCFRIFTLSCCVWSALVRWCPSLSAVIVTQLGTQLSIGHGGLWSPQHDEPLLRLLLDQLLLRLGAARPRSRHFRFKRPYRGGVRGASVDGSYEGYAKDALSS